MTAAAAKVQVPSAAIDGPEITNRAWDLADSYDYCRRIATSHYENFPVGSVLVPGRLRKYFYSIYAFARISDDFADEGYDGAYSTADRLAWLGQWKDLLDRAYEADGRGTGHPVFIALADTAQKFNLPASLFQDLLSAFSQDVTVKRYENIDDLIDYCRRSANPIGRLILLLFGYKDELKFKQSDDICTALQLANHWQDVGVDLAKDRIYLPAEDLNRFDVTVDDLKPLKATGKFKQLMEFEVSRVREMFLRGKPLCTSVSGRLGIELRAVWMGGTTILNKIEANDYDVFEKRPVIGGWDKFRILAKAFNKFGF